MSDVEPKGTLRSIEGMKHSNHKAIMKEANGVLETMRSILFVGMDKDGFLHVMTSCESLVQILGLLERAKYIVNTGTLETIPGEDGA